MQLRDQHKFAMLMTLHLLWGLVLWFSISKYGLGVSTDAVHLLFGGLNLAAGNGLTSYDGTFLVLWPPLYPMLLALVRWTTGAEMPAAAIIVQAIAFLGLSISLALLCLKLFPHNFGLALIATVLAQIGPAVLIAFGMVGSDYVHLFLVAALIVMTGRYIQAGTGRAFVALAVVALLTTMLRYLGVAAVAASALSIVLMGQGQLGRRITNAIVLCSTVIPMAIWLGVTSQRYSRRDPISLAENFGWFSRSILEWLLAPGSPKREIEGLVPVLWLAVLALLAVSLVLARRQSIRQTSSSMPEARARSDPWPYGTSLLIYGLCYTLALFGSASIAYFNKLGGRFLLPLYLPLSLLPVITADGIIRATAQASPKVLPKLVSAICYLGLAGMAIVLLQNTYPLVLESHAEGATGGENAFNNRPWHDNAALAFWDEHPPLGTYLLYSNEPDGVAFNTQHATRPAPRKRSGPYGTADIPLTDYVEEMFGSGSNVYLIWIEPSAYEHYYRPEDLREIASVQSLFDSETGSVYELRPRAPE